jgi:hypothetical protein
LDAPIIELLRRVRAGDSSASDELMPVVYGELRRIARQHLRKERQDHTLQPTALVNEVYLRMFESSKPQFSDRAHFMAMASRMMRSILVDDARARGCAKRGGHDDVDRPAHHFGRLFGGHASEVPHFDNLGRRRILTRHGLDRQVQIQQHELRFAHAWLRRRLSGRGSS